MARAVRPTRSVDQQWGATSTDGLRYTRFMLQHFKGPLQGPGKGPQLTLFGPFSWVPGEPFIWIFGSPKPDASRRGPCAGPADLLGSGVSVLRALAAVRRGAVVTLRSRARCSARVRLLRTTLAGGPLEKGPRQWEGTRTLRYWRALRRACACAKTAEGCPFGLTLGVGPFTVNIKAPKDPAPGSVQNS